MTNDSKSASSADKLKLPRAEAKARAAKERLQQYVLQAEGLARETWCAGQRPDAD
jgi:hypothetical protein